MEVQRDCYDPKYEWNAPQYRDFEADSADEDEGKDRWFESRRESGLVEAPIVPAKEEDEMKAEKNIKRKKRDNSQKPTEVSSVPPDEQNQDVAPVKLQQKEPEVAPCSSAPIALNLDALVAEAKTLSTPIPSSAMVPATAMNLSSVKVTDQDVEAHQESPVLKQIKRVITFSPQGDQTEEPPVSPRPHRPRTRSMSRKERERQESNKPQNIKQRLRKRPMKRNTIKKKASSTMTQGSQTRFVRKKALGLQNNTNRKKKVSRTMRNARRFAQATEATVLRRKATTRHTAARKGVITTRRTRSQTQKQTKSTEQTLVPSTAPRTANKRKIKNTKQVKSITTTVKKKRKHDEPLTSPPKDDGGAESTAFPSFMRTTRSRMNANSAINWGTTPIRAAGVFTQRTKSAMRRAKAPSALTVPKTPTFATESRVRRKTKLSVAEQLEMKQTHAVTNRKHAKQAKKSRRAKMLEHPISEVTKAALPVRSIKPLTQPVEFNFSTTRRLGAQTSKALTNTAQSHVSELDPVDAAMNRQRHKKKHELTRPKAFSFATDDRSSYHRAYKPLPEQVNNDDHSPYVPWVNQVKSFWKTLKKDSPVKKRVPVSARGVTIPQPPRLTRGGKKKETLTLTTAERQLQELQSKPRFKAKPMPTYSSVGQAGLPRVYKVKLTVPEEVRLHTAERSGTRTTHVLPRAAKPFKARPVPEQVLKASRPVLPKTSSTLTTPLTPNLSFIYAPKKPSHQRDESATALGELPVEVSSAPVPFHLQTEERGARTQKEIQRQREEELARVEAARIFKAKPLPKSIRKPLVPSTRSAALKPPLTQPKPFHMATDVRGEIAQGELQRKIEQEKLEEIQKAFKARPVPKMLAVPESVKSKAPLTVVSPFQLNTENRKEKRVDYNEIVKEKISKQEREKRLQQQLAEEAVVKVMEARRKAHLPKARAFVKSQTPLIKKSSAPLTTPVSPRLGRV